MQSREATSGLFSPLHISLISRQRSSRCSSKTSINCVLSGKKNDVSIMTLLLRENNWTSLLLMSLLARISPHKVPLCVLLDWFFFFFPFLGVVFPIHEKIGCWGLLGCEEEEPEHPAAADKPPWGLKSSFFIGNWLLVEYLRADFPH